MNHRDRPAATPAHRQAVAVPIDVGATAVTGIPVRVVAADPNAIAGCGDRLRNGTTGRLHAGYRLVPIIERAWGHHHP